MQGCITANSAAKDKGIENSLAVMSGEQVPCSKLFFTKLKGIAHAMPFLRFSVVIVVSVAGIENLLQ